jgi:hypothetical protein
MPAKKKKRASFSDTVIPVSVIEEKLESSESAVPSQEKESSRTLDVPEIADHQTIQLDLEDQLLSDAQEPEIKKKNMMLYRIGIGVSTCIIAVALGLFLFSTKKSHEVVNNVQIEPTNTPTPTPEFIRSNIGFEVLNGSGVAGMAAKSADELKKVGYTIVSIGNTAKASESALYVRESVSIFDREQILSDMQKLFGEVILRSETISSSASARFVIGTESP